MVIVWEISSEAVAQTLKFGHIGYEEGLEGYSIWDTAQDSHGRIWIASSFGLASYNNYEVKPVELANAPWTRDTVRTLFVDSIDTLWIGTYQQGLVRRTADGTFTTYRHDPSDTNSISSDRVLSITQDGDGNVWLGTANGLNLFDAEAQQFINPQSALGGGSPGNLPNHVIRTLLLSSNGDIWVGTQSGLATLNPTTQKTTAIPLTEPEPLILDLHEDENQILWVASTTGIYRYDPRTQSTTQPYEELKGLRVLTISQNKKGLWFGSLGSGLFHLDSAGRLTNHTDGGDKYSLAGNAIISTMTDRVDNTLFIGTFNNGISTLALDSLTLGRHDNTSSNYTCMESSVVYSILLEKNNQLWLGTDEGLAKIDQTASNCTWYGSHWENKAYLPRNLMDVMRSSTGDLYALGSHSLAKLDHDTDQVVRFSNPDNFGSAKFLHEIKSGFILVGTSTGLFKFHMQNETWDTFTKPGSPNGNIQFHDISVDQSGTQWFATSRGIFYLNKNDQVEPLRQNGKVAFTEDTSAIWAHYDGTFWVAINDDRLLVLDQTGTIMHTFDDVDQFPGRTVEIIGDRQQNLWISTLTGLVQIGKDFAVKKHFQASDGLQGNAFTKGAAYLAENGELIFGGRQGINRFFPHEVTPNTTPPSPHFEELLVHNQLVKPGQAVEGFTMNAPIDQTTGLEFNHQQQMFTVRFSAFDITSSTGITYAYKLDGFDADWIEIQSPKRSATYTSLQPGRYTLQLKTANQDGVWSSTIKRLPITIKPAPWATWQAKLFYLLLATIIAITVLRRRQAAQLEYAENLEREVHLRTREVEQQRETIKDILARKNALFENISHEFKTPLTLLIGPLEQLRHQLDDPSQSERVDLALRNAKRLLSMINQLLRLAEVTQATH